jgi:uncharacterized protein YjiS (DUF1127 family)
MLLYRQRVLPNLDFSGKLRSVIARISDMRRTMAGRRAISLMDERMLSDIGLSRNEALYEINRRPWDTTPFNRH